MDEPQYYAEIEAAIRPPQWEAEWILRPCPVCGILLTSEQYNLHHHTILQDPTVTSTTADEH